MIHTALLKIEAVQETYIFALPNHKVVDPPIYEVSAPFYLSSLTPFVPILITFPEPLPSSLVF